MSFFSWLKRTLGIGPKPSRIRRRPLVLTKAPGPGSYSPAPTYVVDDDDGFTAAVVVDAAVEIASDPVVQEAAADFFSGVAEAIGDAISSIDFDFS